MNIVPISLCIEQTTTEIKDRTEEEKCLHEEEQKLTRKLSKIRTEFLEKVRQIEKMDLILREKYKVLVDELLQYENLLEKIKSTSVVEKEQAAKEQTFGEEQTLEKEIEEHVKYRTNKLKSIYRKITMKTHPDRTTDKILNELFLEAKSCYKANDLQGLEEVWECVKIKKSRLLSRLIERISKLKLELDKASIEFGKLINSNSYRMSIDYFSNNIFAQNDAEQFFVALLEQRIEILKQKMKEYE